MPYKIIVADNFHYQDQDEEHVAGIFEDGDSALAEAHRIVDASLTNALRPGMTAEALYEAYTMFGEDPYVVPINGAPDVSFSAWDYARWKAPEIIIACVGTGSSRD